jgi:arylsulfatase A-like enzyme
MPFLGFDEYHGAETLRQIDEVKIIRRGGYISDETFVEYIKYFLNESETNSENPLFLFGISMENHQNYRNKYDSGDFTGFTVSTYNSRLNERDRNSFKNYTQGVQNADKALGELADFVEKRERPTVLVYFGDHLPSIGLTTAYVDSGFVKDNYSQSSRKKLYATPYLIYANYPLKDIEKYEMIGSYDLLNILSDLIGSGKTQYMGHLSAMRRILAYYNVRTSIPINNLTENQQNMLKIQHFATYKAMKN